MSFCPPACGGICLVAKGLLDRPTICHRQAPHRRDLRIPLDGIREIRIATADDFRDCFRTFGNGGLFGYYGQFSTSKLGSSTWYVTNRSNSVVVITSSKTAVFSPDDMDGFLAAIQAAAPVPATAPGGARLDSKQSNGAARLTGALVGGAIAIVVLAIVAFAMLYSPGPPSYTLTAESLTIHDRFYPVTLPPSGVDIEHIRLIDVGADADWRPTARTNGFANAHYCSGWFRVASGKKIRMYQADSTHLVLLPPKGDGAAVLLETPTRKSSCGKYGSGGPTARKDPTFWSA